MTQVRVLHAGEGYCAVEKPPGILVIPGRKGNEPSLRDVFRAQLGRDVFVVHRLDRETSGVLLFALEARAHRALSMAFEAGRVEKTYLALVQGQLESSREIDLALMPSRRGRMRPARAGEVGKVARTRVKPVEKFEKATLVEAEPLTGRQHQIRVHLAAIGHPLLYDPQYGPSDVLTAKDFGGRGDDVIVARTPLHAFRLSLPPLEGIRAASISSEIPPDIGEALSLLRSQKVP